VEGRVLWSGSQYIHTSHHFHCLSSLATFCLTQLSVGISTLLFFFLRILLARPNFPYLTQTWCSKMAMNFQGLPGDQDMVRRTFQKKFEDTYGKNANAKELYIAGSWVFLRFARLFARPAYLLGHLQTFYTGLETTLDMFVAEYCKGKTSTNGMAPPYFEDPFRYFNAGYDYACFLLHLRAALRANSRSAEPLAYELAQDVLDILDNEDRRTIVSELLSADLATELDKRVGQTSEHGFWQVRKTIARNEMIFSKNAQYLRDRLEHSEEEEVPKPAGGHRQARKGEGAGKRSPSPLGGRWSFTPPSSTFKHSDADNKDKEVDFEKVLLSE
jgi:hypothetical protein